MSAPSGTPLLRKCLALHFCLLPFLRVAPPPFSLLHHRGVGDYAPLGLHTLSLAFSWWNGGGGQEWLQGFIFHRLLQKEKIQVYE